MDLVEFWRDLEVFPGNLVGRWCLLLVAVLGCIISMWFLPVCPLIYQRTLGDEAPEEAAGALLMKNDSL